MKILKHKTIQTLLFLTMVAISNTACFVKGKEFSISDNVPLTYSGVEQMLKDTMVELPISLAIDVDNNDCSADGETNVYDVLCNDLTYLYSVIDMSITSPTGETTTVDDCYEDLGGFPNVDDEVIVTECPLFFYPKEAGIYSFSFEVRLSSTSPDDEHYLADGYEDPRTDPKTITFELEVLDTRNTENALTLNEIFQNVDEVPLDNWDTTLLHIDDQLQPTDFTEIDALEISDWENLQFVEGETTESFEATTTLETDGNEYYAFVINGITYSTPFMVIEDTTPGVIFQDSNNDGISEIYLTFFVEKKLILPDLEFDGESEVSSSYRIFIAKLQVGN